MDRDLELPGLEYDRTQGRLSLTPPSYPWLRRLWEGNLTSDQIAVGWSMLPQRMRSHLALSSAEEIERWWGRWADWLAVWRDAWIDHPEGIHVHVTTRYGAQVEGRWAKATDETTAFQRLQRTAKAWARWYPHTPNGYASMWATPSPARSRCWTLALDVLRRSDPMWWQAAISTPVYRHPARWVFSESPDVLDDWLDHGLNPNLKVDGMTLLQRATLSHRLDGVERLLAAGAAPNAQSSDPDDVGPLSLSLWLPTSGVFDRLRAAGGRWSTAKAVQKAGIEVLIGGEPWAWTRWIEDPRAPTAWARSDGQSESAWQAMMRDEGERQRYRWARQWGYGSVEWWEAMLLRQREERFVKAMRPEALTAFAVAQEKAGLAQYAQKMELDVRETLLATKRL